MSKTKLYTFHYSKAEGGMVSKTEEQLTDSEKAVLVQRLQDAWDNSPQEAKDALAVSIITAPNKEGVTLEAEEKTPAKEAKAKPKKPSKK